MVLVIDYHPETMSLDYVISMPNMYARGMRHVGHSSIILIATIVARHTLWEDGARAW